MNAATVCCAMMLIASAAFADGGPATVRISSEQVLSTSGSTRATFYAASNKLLTIGDKTHITWLDAISEIMVRTFDHATGELLPTTHVGSGVDNHSGAAMCADPEGYIYMAFGPHHGAFQFARSTRPNDSTQWEALPGFGTKCTYPSMVCDADGTLHICYRGGDIPCRLLYQRLPRGGEWSEPRELVIAGVPNGYTQFGSSLCVAPDGSLHMAYHIYDMHPAAGKAAGHMVSRDGGGTWTLMDGTPLTLPVTPEMDAFVEQGPELDLRVGNVACDAQSRPHFVVNDYKGGARRATLWRWRDGWDAVQLAPIVAPLMEVPPAFSSDAQVSIDGSGKMWLALTAGTRSQWGGPTNEVFLLYSEDLGDTFSALQVSPTDPEISNWGASLQRPVGHNTMGPPMLIYTHGTVGKGLATDDRTEVRLVIFERE